MKSDVNKKFDSMQNEIDSIKYDNVKVNNFVQATRNTVSKVNTSIGLVNYNIDQIDQKMRDLVVLEQNFSDTEKYLGYVLPT